MPFLSSGKVEAELLHTYSRIDPYDTLILCVRVAVLTAVTLTVPIVLFPVSARLADMMLRLRLCKQRIKCSIILFLSGEESDPADGFPQQDLLLAEAHCHRLHSAHFHQPAGHFCTKYPGNLWGHW